jgi:hypothetical protein
MPWPVSGPAGELFAMAQVWFLRHSAEMAMLNYDVFEAFKSAGVPDEKARKAAEALSGAVHAAEISGLKATVNLHTWMIGFVIALNIAILARMISLA